MTNIERYDARNSIEIAGDAWAIAHRIAKTDFVPDALRGKPEAVLACILSGHELGISPMQSLQEIHVIKGRPSLSAKMQRAIIIRAGHEIWIEESTSTRAIVKGRRHDTAREGAVTWTEDDAKRAGLMGKDNWKGYPAAMLIARASSQLSRNLFPDVLAGFGYSMEELEDGFDVEALLASASPTSTSTSSAPTSRVRASRTATRGADAPAKTEPDPEPPTPREQAPLPGEDDDRDPDAIIETNAREADAVFDRDPIGDDSPPDDGPDFDEGARARSGPQQIAIQFSNRKITDRAVRLRICGTIIGREIKSGNDLTADEISTVLRTLDETDVEATLPGEEAGGESDPSPEQGDPPAASAEPRARRAPAEPPTDPEQWTADGWRALLADRGVKASELLREAQRLAVLEEHEPPETLDGIAGLGIAGQLVGYVEDLALERRKP